MSAAGSRVIDVHIHTIPPALVDGVEGGAFPSVAVERHSQGLVFRFPEMAPSPPAQDGLLDFPRLALWAEGEGIDLQVVGPWTDLLGYTLPAGEASAWSRAYNEALAAACASQPGMVPMATIPLQFPEAAVRELEAAAALGCRGVMAGTDLPGSDLDNGDLDPVWEAAAGLSLPILLHPTFLCVPRRLRSRGLKNAVGRCGEITVALTRLVYSGALLRHPGLSVVAALGGGGLVPGSKRILRNHELGWAEAAGDVAASLERLYFDSLVIDPAFLRYLVGQVGASRVMLGSDYPFPWEPHPVRYVESAGLSPEENAAVLGGTAAGIFGLD
jgi:aminocarboxymuconate-semialdehyde decarboxylase